MQTTTFVPSPYLQYTAEIPTVLMTETYNDEAPTRADVLTHLLDMTNYARGLYDVGQKLSDLKENNVSEEYLRGQVELIIELSYGLASEDSVKEAVAALIFQDFS